MLYSLVTQIIKLKYELHENTNYWQGLYKHLICVCKSRSKYKISIPAVIIAHIISLKQLCIDITVKNKKDENMKCFPNPYRFTCLTTFWLLRQNYIELFNTRITEMQNKLLKTLQQLYSCSLCFTYLHVQL